jgi:hypothetical protein
MPSRRKGGAGTYSIIFPPKNCTSLLSELYDSPIVGRKSMLKDLNALKKEVMLIGYRTFMYKRKFTS